MPKPGSHIGCSTTPLLIVSRLVGIFSVSARVPYSSKMRRFDFLLIRSGEVKSSRFFVCIVIDYWLVNIIRSGCSAMSAVLSFIFVSKALLFARVFIMVKPLDDNCSFLRFRKAKQHKISYAAASHQAFHAKSFGPSAGSLRSHLPTSTSTLTMENWMD